MPVLLVESDLELGAAIRRTLELDCVGCVWVRRSQDARSIMKQALPTVIVLSLSDPEESFALLESWRGSGDKTPVVVVTSREGIDDCIRALKRGANDFVAKPVKMPELLARVRRLMHKSAGTPAAPPRSGAVTLPTAAPSRQ
jgi:DNA-binding response OmpR family regulator